MVRIHGTQGSWRTVCGSGVCDGRCHRRSRRQSRPDWISAVVQNATTGWSDRHHSRFIRPHSPSSFCSLRHGISTSKNIGSLSRLFFGSVSPFSQPALISRDIPAFLLSAVLSDTHNLWNRGISKTSATIFSKTGTRSGNRRAGSRDLSSSGK